jgi:catechol 2,3-dioxygenase-like lactoylglutathione lyase family enzyme
MSETVHHIHHVGLTITDLDRSVEFYTRHLGCTIVSEQEKVGGYLAEIVGLADAHVRMCHLRAPEGPLVLELFQYLVPSSLRVELTPRLIGNPHLCFVVSDLEGLYGMLREAGVEFISAPTDIDTGVNRGGRGLYLRDPDGIIIELFQPPVTKSMLS